MKVLTLPLVQALDAGTRKLLWAVVVLGAAALLAGVLADPARAMTSLLVNAFFFVSVALAGPVFIALMSVANAGWHTVFKRVPEAMGRYLPVGAVTMLLLIPGLPALYPWARPGAAEADHLLHEKHAFLNVPFFIVRLVVLLAIWVVFSEAMRRRSVAQDQDPDLRHTRAHVRWSAAFIVVAALTFCLAAFDWIMTLEPHWFSTIFGLYNLGGMLTAGTAVITVTVILLRRSGALPRVTEAHLHDLGKLLFGFATVWAYLWLSQYLLIWYSNIPEETTYFLARAQGGWSFLFWMNLVLGWAVPFVMLLPRAGKRSETNLLWACGFLLAGRWLDLYLMSAPGGSPLHDGIGLIELAPFAGFAALFILVISSALTKTSLVPRNDPYLEESLHLHG